MRQIIEHFSQDDGLLDDIEQIEGIDEAMAPDLGRLLEDAYRLERLKRELKEAEDLVKAKANAIYPQLVEQMTMLGMTSTRVRDLTLSIKEAQYVSKKGDKDGFTTDYIVDVLKKIGWSDIVSEGYAAGTLKSIVLGKMKEGEDIPDELLECLNVGSTHTIASRKVPSK
jgi:hypothetical protein